MRRFIGVAVALFVATTARALPGQSLLYRSANLGGTWVVDPGVVQFNFVHRFYIVPGTLGHVVVNDPTFTLATGLGPKVAVGGQFATHSILISQASGAQSTNETQLFARWRPWASPESSRGLPGAPTPPHHPQ